MGAMNPPDSLSVENVQTLRSVRRDIYYHGMIGGGTCLYKTNFPLINLVKSTIEYIHDMASHTLNSTDCDFLSSFFNIYY